MYRLLIVEDEALERRALKMIIEKEFKDKITIVGETSSGTEAVALHKQLKPHLIMMDINIHGINGIESSERIKKADKSTIIIILTAYDEFDFAHKALRASVNDYILKPARPMRIIEAIHNQIDMLKTNGDIAPMLHQLEINIKQADYKKSKDWIHEISNHIFETNGKDTQSISQNLTEVMDRLVNIALDLEVIHDQQIEKIKKKSKNDLDLCLNPYKAQKCLMEMADLILNKMVYQKDDDYHNDINKILDYIEKKYKKNITLEEVAQFSGVSPFYLSKLFKKKVGINFSTYVTNKKMEMAKELLENTDSPIINIALELSYNEPNYFSKVFKKTLGVTPTEYRNTKLNHG